MDKAIVNVINQMSEALSIFDIIVIFWWRTG